MRMSRHCQAAVDGQGLASDVVMAPRTLELSAMSIRSPVCRLIRPAARHEAVQPTTYGSSANQSGNIGYQLTVSATRQGTARD
jgi:hypothetical protein